MSALLTGRDVITVLPTGAGKSPIDLFAGISSGLTVVVSPSIALQRTSCTSSKRRRSSEGLRSTRRSASGRPTRRGTGSRVEKRGSSSSPPSSWRRTTSSADCTTWASASSPSTKRTASPAGGTTSGRTTCVGRCTRPSRPSGDRRTTATAPNPCARRSRTRLRLVDPAIVVRGVDRPNIDLAVRRRGLRARQAGCRSGHRRRASGSGAASIRRRAAKRRTMPPSLAERGLRAAAYHAGLGARERSVATTHSSTISSTSSSPRTRSAWASTSRMCASSCTRPCRIRSTPTTRRSVARAARRPAAAMLFYRSEDLGLRKYFAARSVDRDRLIAAYQAVAGSDSPLRARSWRPPSTSRCARRPACSIRLPRAVPSPSPAAGPRPDLSSRTPRPQMPPKRRPNDASGSRSHAWRSCGDTPRRGTAAADCCSGTSAKTSLSRAGTATGVAPVLHRKRPRMSRSCRTRQAPPSIMSSGARERGRRGERPVTVFFEDRGYKVLALQAVEENELLRRVN